MNIEGKEIKNLMGVIEYNDESNNDYYDHTYVLSDSDIWGLFYSVDTIYGLECIVMILSGYEQNDSENEYDIEIPIFAFSEINSEYKDKTMDTEYKNNSVMVYNERLEFCDGNVFSRNHYTFKWNDLKIFNKMIFGKSWRYWLEQCECHTTIDLSKDGEK